MNTTKTDHSKVGKRSKRKGKTYERRCAKILKEFTDVNFRSTPGSGGFNKQGVSIREELFCGDLISDSPKFRYCIEAKNRESFSWTAILKSPDTAEFTKWWHQCVEDAKGVNLEPLLFFKPNNRDDFIVMTKIEWSNLLHRYLKKHKSHLLCPVIELGCYDTPLTFTVEEKDQKGKKVKKTVTTKLPTAVMVDWKQFVKHHDPKLMFKD
jgi:hypothetical protein